MISGIQASLSTLVNVYMERKGTSVKEGKGVLQRGEGGWEDSYEETGVPCLALNVVCFSSQDKASQMGSLH